MWENTNPADTTCNELYTTTEVTNHELHRDEERYYEDEDTEVVHVYQFSLFRSLMPIYFKCTINPYLNSDSANKTRDLVAIYKS